MAVTGWVLDKSAAVRSGEDVVGDELAELAGSLFVCQVGELEQLHSARSGQAPAPHTRELRGPSGDSTRSHRTP